MTTSSWNNEKKLIIKKNPLANLPYIEDGDLIVTQSNACLLYLGNKFGLLGKTPQDRRDCEQVLCEIMDMRNQMSSVFYNGIGNNENNELSNLMCLNQLAKLEDWLSIRKTKFLISETPSAPDFHLFELLDQLKTLSLVYRISPWNKNNAYPYLQLFYSNFDCLPFLTQYRSSFLSKLPINNKMAKYGTRPPIIPEPNEIPLSSTSSSSGLTGGAAGGSENSTSTNTSNTPNKKKNKMNNKNASAIEQRNNAILRDAIEQDTTITIKNENTLIYSRGQFRNSAFMFLKPHAVTPSSIALVKGFLSNGGFKIISEGRISCEEIDSKELIDKHYYGIASKATSLHPKDLNMCPLALNIFNEAYGVQWQEALDQNLVFNAVDACTHLEIDMDELDYLWSLSKNGRKRVKLGGGFYCGLIETKGKHIYVINGFFMSMRAKFTKPGSVIYFFSIEWNPSDSPWSWFRSKGCGPTDPSQASNSTLRGLLHVQWEELGLDSPLNMMDNGIHVSASPFEALIEHMNWFGSSIASDAFGKQLLSAGILEESILRWSLDPQVSLSADSSIKTHSLFELLEDKNASECLSELLALQTRERSSLKPSIVPSGSNDQMDTVLIRCGNSEATIYLHGAHVTSWKVGGNEKIFVSEQAVYNGSKAIRGGIPVCWPQFGDMGPCKAQHGFARNFKWNLVQEESSPLKCCENEGSCLLRLDSTMVQTIINESSDNEMKSNFLIGWDLEQFPFILEMRIWLSNNMLNQEFTVINPNTSTCDLSFTCALHSYFKVSNASQSTVEGLFDCNYLDNLDNRISKTAEEGGNGDVTVLFKGEVDRIYQNVPRILTIRDVSNGNHGIQIHTNDSFSDAIVWNPHIIKAKNMSDFGDDEYSSMICCEVGKTKQSVILKPSQIWKAKQEFRAI